MSLRADTAQLVSPGLLASLYAGHGIRAADVPSTGQHGPSLLHPNVVANAWTAQELRLRVVSHTLLSLEVDEAGRMVGEVPGDGSYTVVFEVYVDAELEGTSMLILAVGGDAITATISAVVAGAPRASASVAVEVVGLLATITAGVTGSVRVSAAVQIAPPAVEIEATITAAVAGQVRANAAIAIFDPGQVLPTLTEGRRRVKGGTLTPVKLPAMDVAEVDDVAFIFDPRSFDFEPLLSVQMIVEPRVGSDPGPQPLNVGAYQVFGHTVIQRMSGARGVPGVTYLIRVEVTNVKGRRQLATAFMKVLRLL